VTFHFLPRDAMHKRGLCRHAVSVCASVRLSVTFVDHVKTNKHIFEIFLPSGSHTVLVIFPYQMGWRYSDGNPPNGGVECRWCIGTNRDSGLIAGYRRLLDVRTTKWQKQLPRTMQCRSHSRRRTIECLFVAACSWKTPLARCPADQQSYSNPAKSIQFMKCFTVSAKQVTKPTKVVGLQYKAALSVELSPIRSTKRFAWWSSCSKSSRLALYASANGFSWSKSAKCSVEGLSAWTPRTMPH